ncbi:hypothetical protein DdX_06949 [Ditylenchus destructor]|uniref:Uncharacterized protein n=1 Tax=Ditylenchus destructor TaxID=166010 RepID=A0AAD4N9D3_9BILA|nr:hypothetical protein DdX_06949 [Ditylenchus destructor]
MPSTTFHSFFLASALLLVIFEWIQPNFGAEGTPIISAATNLADIISASNAGVEFENLEKRRNRELFGKRSSASLEGGYDRYSRRSHELFGKRTDPEMILRELQEDESEPIATLPNAERIAEVSSLLDDDNSKTKGAVMNFLIFSGYPSHFPNSQQLIEKLRENASTQKHETSDQQPKVVFKRRNRELFGKRSTIAPGPPADDLEMEDAEKLTESQLSALISFLAANKHQQPRQRRARSGELFGR